MHINTAENIQSYQLSKFQTNIFHILQPIKLFFYYIICCLQIKIVFAENSHMRAHDFLLGITCEILNLIK